MKSADSTVTTVVLVLQKLISPVLSLETNFDESISKKVPGNRLPCPRAHILWMLFMSGFRNTGLNTQEIKILYDIYLYISVFICFSQTRLNPENSCCQP